MLSRFSLITRLLPELRRDVQKRDKALNCCKNVIKLNKEPSIPGESDIQQVVAYAKEKQTIPVLEQDVMRLRTSLEAIDKSSILRFLIIEKQ